MSTLKQKKLEKAMEQLNEFVETASQVVVKVRCGVSGQNRLKNAWLYQLRHPNAKPHFGELYS